MKIDNRKIHSPVLQGGVYDWSKIPSPENLKKSIFYFKTFSNFQGVSGHVFQSPP